MNLQIIHSPRGQPEYVLLPVKVYYEMRTEIEKKLDNDESDYVPFILENYVKNPAALARIKANTTQEELARELNVSQAYVSKIERQETVSAKALVKISKALEKLIEKNQAKSTTKKR